jgi:hypothetical protein
MDLRVAKPLKPTSDDVVKVPIANGTPTPEGHIVDGTEKVHLTNTVNKKSAVLEPEIVPEDYHGKRVAVLSKNMRKELDLECGDTVDVKAVESNRLSTKARNFEELEDGKIHVFNAHIYQGRVPEFISEVLSSHLRGHIITEGASYTLLKNEQESDADNKYDIDIYVESCDPNPCLYREPIDLTGRSEFENRFHPEVVVHDEGVRPYDLFNV